MDKNKVFALYGVNMIDINGFNFKYVNGYTIIKNKDDLILHIDCEVSDEEQYEFLMKCLNDVLCNSNEFNISLYNDVRYADGTKGNIVDKYKCVVADGEIFTVNKNEEWTKPAYTEVKLSAKTSFKEKHQEEVK